MRCAAVYAGPCLIPHTFLQSLLSDCISPVAVRHLCTAVQTLSSVCSPWHRISAIELCTMAYANAMPACVIGIPAIHILLVVMISAAHRLRSRDQCRYKAKPASSAFVSSSWVPRITYMKTCMPIRLGSQMCIMLIWYTPAVIMI